MILREKLASCSEKHVLLLEAIQAKYEMFLPYTLFELPAILANNPRLSKRLSRLASLQQTFETNKRFSLSLSLPISFAVADSLIR